MRLLHLLLPSLLCVSLTKAYLVAPPGTPAPGATQRCSGWVQSSYALSCDIIVRVIGMTLPQFQEWNPATSMMGPGCNMINGLDYCIEVDFIQYTATMTTAQSTTSSPGTTTKASTTSTTTSGNGIATPTPIQAGMVANCNRFYFVKDGDICVNIAASQSVSLTNLYAWNPAIGTSCGGLWANVYICVGTGTAAPTTTAPGNGVATPTPIQAGMTTRCKTFHQVVAGEVCFGVARPAGISIANFFAWNPAVGTDCGALLPGYYVCVALL
ncbi:hypothetical protein D7B24_005291 [Verticillium nonalfalfae]|uniref:LysM domain-containing protein n=1 Tax=Verticillium nonalfalfae TaxID=1051616 RepID=A0A3M9YDV9_9PEZI|nr:uncharacterized protein D7B24_005291 [Verticillium nonalfalfae]RNJ57976.1 hypothetical protein D7B24_005291 [Verticillium nonalfalfae]